ncbi:MAG: translation initiation factor IF-2 [Rhabdochlamydiaceae bacterium]
MAKNLKITVKNAQLAEALKKIKKPAPAASQPEVKKAAPKPAPVEKEIPKPAALKEEAAPPIAKEPAAPKMEEPVKKEAPPAAAAQETPPPAPPKPAPQPVLGPKYPAQHSRPHEAGRGPGGGQRPPYQPRTGGYQGQNQGGQRPPYQPRTDGYQGQNQGGQRPPYQPRTGGYQGQNQGGQRPPYQPRTGGYQAGPREPYQRPAGPAGGPGGPGGQGSGPRPPYQPRTGGYQGQNPGGPRPPYQPRTGGYQGAPRPYTPGGGPGGSGGFRRPGGPPRFGSAPIPKDFPSTKAPRGEEEVKKKIGFGFKDKDKANKKPEIEKSFDSRDRQGLRDENDEGWRPRKGRGFKSRFMEEEVIIRPKSLSVRLPITIKDLASEMKLKASQLISNLFMKGVVLTLNDFIDDETTVQLLGHDFDCEITIDTTEEKRLKITEHNLKQEIGQTAAEELILRSPVVAFMGHVDHGKTSLIDAIRKTNVAAGEAGAITQHIGAFKCHTPYGDITILDTPGHEAFSAMRSRGAEVTDIIVLVVAGDEGLRTQSIEAIEQAKAAGVLILVAINKSDKPNFDADNVYRQLAEQNLLPETWGGQTITVNCSAVTGEGIKTLLEMLALQAEVLELKANPKSRARGAVIESEMHKGMGAVATLLVQNGTLRLGDAVVFADHWGRVKTMQDERGKNVMEAGPSTPVKITGLSGLPVAGSDFIVVKDENEARHVYEERAILKKHTALQAKRAGIDLTQHVQKQEKKVLHLMLRADVQGSLEALKHSLEKITSSKIDINIVSSAVGEISESDIERAAASKAMIIGFHTQIESRAESLIKELHVKVKLHDIIYHAVDNVKEIMISMLDKIAQENDVGEVAVKAVFKSSQIGNIAGCQVTEGTVKRSCHVRVVRNKEVIWKGPIASLKKVKEDVREVSKGHECGVLLQGFNDFKEGDILQAFEVTYLTPEL